jgi:hypothetical protein
VLGFSQATEYVDLTKKNNILNSCSPSQYFYNKRNNAQDYKIGKPKNLKSLEASKLNRLFRISTICQGYLCLMEDFKFFGFPIL